MRIIEIDMLNAVKAKKDWHKDNTAVNFQPGYNKSEIFLHGNHIAEYNHANGNLDVNINTLENWPTVTTKSRLRALGADIYQSKGSIYLNGVYICAAD